MTSPYFDIAFWGQAMTCGWCLAVASALVALFKWRHRKTLRKPAAPTDAAIQYVRRWMGVQHDLFMLSLLFGFVGGFLLVSGIAVLAIVFLP